MARQGHRRTRARGPYEDGDHRRTAGEGGHGAVAVEGPRVPRIWPEETIVCIGGGRSLTVDDVAHCRGRARVIAINDAHRLAPWAEVLYAADSKWWRHYTGVADFGGRKYGLQPDARIWPGVEVLQNTGLTGLELDPAGLRTGKNSGYQAINLAVHLGARRILLLGYDMHAESQATSHWFGQHPLRIRSESPYPSFLAYFETIVQPLRALGVEVINCTRRTALTVFPQQPITEVLA